MLSILMRQRGDRIRRMSACGTKRTWQSRSAMSAFVDKADIVLLSDSIGI
jgi:hypothetical protein